MLRRYEGELEKAFFEMDLSFYERGKSLKEENPRIVEYIRTFLWGGDQRVQTDMKRRRIKILKISRTGICVYTK